MHPVVTSRAPLCRCCAHRARPHVAAASSSPHLKALHGPHSRLASADCSSAVPPTPARAAPQGPVSPSKPECLPSSSAFVLPLDRLAATVDKADNCRAGIRRKWAQQISGRTVLDLTRLFLPFVPSRSPMKTDQYVARSIGIPSLSSLIGQCVCDVLSLAVSPPVQTISI